MSQTDQSQLWDVDAEQRVLGSVLVDPDRLVDLRDWLGVDHYYREAHRSIWSAMLGMSGPIDRVTVASELRARGKWEQVGGHTYIAELTRAAGMPGVRGAVVRCGEIVRDAAVARGIVGTCSVVADRMLTEWRTAESRHRLASECQERLSSAVAPLLARSGRNVGLERVSQTFATLHTEASRRLDGQAAESQPTITTTFPSLDRYVEIPVGLLTVVASRAGVGKSSLAATWMRSYASLGMRPHLVNLEDSDVHFAMRILAATTGVDSRVVRRLLYRGPGRDSDRATLSRLSDALVRLMDLDATWDDTHGLSVESIRMRCRERVREGAGLIIIDHALQIRHPRSGRDTREKVNHIIGELADMASELQVPVIVLTQLNRAAEDKMPTLRDLKESGRWEEDARVVLMLYREDARSVTSGAKDGLIIVAKANHDDAGKRVALRFDPPRCEWRDPAGSVTPGGRWDPDTDTGGLY